MLGNSDRAKFVNRPPLHDETDWCAIQIRVVYQMIRLEYARNPLMVNAPDHYLSQMSHQLMYVPNLGMLSFWLVAVRGRPPGQSIMQSIWGMYHRAHTANNFRVVAFPGYKANRDYSPRGRGKKP
jgi:hypothetical protein